MMSIKEIENFQSFGFSSSLNQSLERMQYKKPTPIQAQAIPIALEGRDVLGSAQTGTGKTAAFILPIIQKLMDSGTGSALVLTPTRELAMQVMDFARKMLNNNPHIPIALLIGGEHMGKQLSQLKRRPRLVIGTPGRVNDHLLRRTLNLHHANFLVLDEADRMLDMGFGIQIDAILEHMPQQRQTLMFSATLHKGIIRLAEKYMKSPERISIGSIQTLPVNLKQDFIHVSQSSKYGELLKELEKRAGTVILFVKTKIGTEKLAFKLRNEGFDVDYIHGDLKQRQRTHVIKKFRQNGFNILVATDVAARGLDIPHIAHVINYDLPSCPEDFIHRIGRTARADAEGSSLSLIAPDEKRIWAEINNKFLNPEGAKKSEPNRGGPAKKRFFQQPAPQKFKKPRRHTVGV